MDKLGSWIELKAGLVVDGGNKAMHGVNSGVRFNTSSASMQLETIDAGASPHNMDYPRTKTAPITSDCDSNTLARAGVVVFGEPSGFPTTYAGFGDAYGAGEPDLSRGVSSMMLNNLWGTNSCRRDCPYVDALSPSLLKYLLNVEDVQQSESLADG